MSTNRKDKLPFSARHPKWYTFFAFLFLLGLLAIGFSLLRYVFKALGAGITSLAEWVSSLASKLDAVVIVALITGAVSIVGVVISSIVAKSIDYRKARREYLAQKREKPYGEFVEMVYKIQQNSKTPNSYTEKDMLADISRFSQEITLWGSAKVANKWVKFRENGANPNAAKDNLFVLEDIMNEMRKDLGLKKVKKGNLLAFFVNDIKQAMKK